MEMKATDYTEEGLLKAGKLIAEGPKDHQKAIITRAALEQLAEKAGIAMSWNDGDPVFHDNGAIENAVQRYDAAERQVRTEQVARLQDIINKSEAGLISKQAANSLVASAAKSMDTMVNDVIKQKVDETLLGDIFDNEKRVKQQLRDQGATDDDIAAAEKLLGPKAPVSTPREDVLMSSADIMKAVENLKGGRKSNIEMFSTAYENKPITFRKFADLVSYDEF